jgi:hypothetical protein
MVGLLARPLTDGHHLRVTLPVALNVVLHLDQVHPAIGSAEVAQEDEDGGRLIEERGEGDFSVRLPKELDLGRHAVDGLECHQGLLWPKRNPATQRA